MTTHDELLDLRARERAASAASANADLELDAASAALATAEAARAQAELEVAAAEDSLAAVASLRTERDALLVSAQQDDNTIAEAEAQAADLEEQISELLRRLERIPPFSAEAGPLRAGLKELRNALSRQSKRAATARASAAGKREQAAVLSGQISTRELETEAALARAREAAVATTSAMTEAERVQRMARGRLDAAGAEQKAAEQAYREALDGLIPGLDPQVPLLLLPVRLETRYTPPRADGGRQLQIRVYPDDVAQDSHEPELTEAEQTSGRTFWEGVWRAGPGAEGEQRRRGAWQQFAGRHGAQRSQWVAQQLRPKNPEARPAGPVPDGQPLPTDPDWPSPAIAPAAWTRAPHVAVLPDRWVFIGYVGERKVFEKWGDLIPQPLATGPAPGDNLVDPTDVGEGMRWMVDFPSALDGTGAIDVGMGVVVDLPADTPHAFDRVVALGVRGTATPDEAADSLQGLLDAHAYTWGLDVVPQGTPTNNDGSGSDAGYARGRVDAAAVDGVVGDDAPARPDDGSDAAQLGAALGIVDPASALWRIAHADSTDQRDAAAMSAVLWPATWGYYLRQMLAPAFDDLPIDAWRRFVIDTVRARGALPALRTGQQPYGILPTTSLSRWQLDPPAADLLLYFFVGSGGPAATGFHRMLWDLDARGASSGYGRPPDSEPPLREALAGRADITATDLDEDGRPELLLLDPGEDGSAPPVYWIGPSVAADGALSGDWRGPLSIPDSPPRLDELTLGTGVAVAGETLYILRQLERRGRARLELARGDSLGPDGVDQWGPTIDGGSSDAATVGRLVGLAVGSTTLERDLDIVALFLGPNAMGDPELSYRVGRIVARGPQRIEWTEPIRTPIPLNSALPVTAAGIALHDINRDGRPELLVQGAQETGQGTFGQYWVGSDLQADGQPAGGWIGPYFLGDAVPGPVLGGGLAIAQVGRSGSVSPRTPTGLVNLLIEARSRWLDAAHSDRVPVIGRGDPDRDILDVLASDALSSSVAARRMIGSDYLAALCTLAGNPLGFDLPQAVRNRCGTQLHSLGLSIDARLDTAPYVDPAVDWTAPWVQAGPLSERDPLSENYLGWAAKATPAELHDLTGITAPDPLLLRLVRHSTLQSLADVAMRLDPPPNGPWREPELVDLANITDPDPRPPDHTLTSWRYISEPQQGRQLGDEVLALSDAGAPDAAEVTELRKALRWLSGRPTAALERLLAESLDLATHRLGAWIGAVAADRLRGMREARATGIHLGGYGFVEDLEPSDDLPVSTGFVHAPSHAHAVTAAVLRSGYLTHRGTAAGDTLAVDLSSQRVRVALDLLDGVRAGQPLGALLGYRVERALRDHPQYPLARYLPALRQLAPLAAGKQIALPTGVAVDDVAARSTCDGLALLRQHAEGKLAAVWGTTPTGQTVALPTKTSPEGRALLGELDRLQDCVDAVSDLAIAESVHQAAQGNPVRSAATLDALGRGEVPPPEPDVVRSARSGIGLTHRLLVVLTEPAADDAAMAAWVSPGRDGWGVRGDAEPTLNAWVAGLLGDPKRVIWGASYPSSGNGSSPATETFALGDLGLSPLDLLAIHEVAPGSDLDHRLLRHAVRHAPPGSEGIRPRLILDRSHGAGPGSVTLSEILETAHAVRDVIAGSRPLEPEDLTEVAVSPPPAARDELAERLATTADSVSSALTALRSLFAFADPAADRATISAALEVPTDELGAAANLLDLPAGVDPARAAAALNRPVPTEFDAISAALLALADCGIPHAVPEPSFGSTEERGATLVVQAVAAAHEAANRLAASGNAGDPIEGFEALLGRGFRALPRFRPVAGNDLSQALAERAVAADATPAVTAPWLQGVAQVRAGAARLDRAFLYSEALDSGVLGRVEIAQLPPTGAAPERWAALPPLATQTTIPAGRLSLAMHAPFGLEIGGAVEVCGLQVDDWLDVVPSRSETTGVSVHYNGPDHCAPQAMLLAVPPVAGRPWDLDTLEDVLDETIQLVHIRGVDPDALPELGHYLPALFLACNIGGDPEGDTISTQAPVA